MKYTIELTTALTFDVEKFEVTAGGLCFIAPDSWTFPEILQSVQCGSFWKVERLADGDNVYIESYKIKSVTCI